MTNETEAEIFDVALSSNMEKPVIVFSDKRIRKARLSIISTPNMFSLTSDINLLCFWGLKNL